MKPFFLISLLLSSLLCAQEPREKIDHRIVIEAPEAAKKAPLFYTAKLAVTAHFGREKLLESAEIDFAVIQGEAPVLSVQLVGGAPILKVEGEEVKSWSQRQEGESRFLDFIPVDPKAKSLQARVVFERPVEQFPTSFDLSTFGPGASSGFSATYVIGRAEGLHHQLISAQGVLSLQSEEGLDHLTSAGPAALTASLTLSAAQAPAVELRETRLEGEIFAEEGSATFRLMGTAHVTSTEPVSLTVLHGRAAPIAPMVTAEYRLKLAEGGYQIEFHQPGIYPIDLEFVTPIQTQGEWKKITFAVPSGAVVPIHLKGLAKAAVFEAASPVSPMPAEGAHQAFLPASGACQFAWQTERKSDDGKLFYTSEAMGEISVGAGLLRQVTALKVKTLQGALPSLKIQLAGAGEILAVEGENVLSWQVTPERVLEISLSRAVTQEASFIIRAQSALAALPVKTEPLRLTPLDVVRHSGFFRVYNRGAVRIEVMKPLGLTQLSPEQFPEAPALLESTRQVFHYRYPAAARSFLVAAERVKPEINVSQNLAYELSETDRVLRADLELEIREAGIREWEFYGPADYSVVSVTGADVSDYVVSEPEAGRRRLKVIFAQEVTGRRLVKAHFEKNEAAQEAVQAGVWNLPSLSFPGDTAVGGEVGVSAAPGFRVSPGVVEGLVEMPLARLLKRAANLQQAFRLRAENWTAEMQVTALSQNVQADSFHLYSLKEGTAYVSVLLNFFVMGAPVNEWRLALPEGIEHLDVDGRDIRDYRQSEGSLVVPLHRPVMGAYQLLVTYEQKAGGSLKLGELAPENVQGEHGFVQVVSPGQVEVAAAPVGDFLQELDPVELPSEYQLMSHAPTLRAWSYQARPFTLEREITWFHRSEMASRVVEFAEISSRIARDGGVVTISNFDVRTRGGRSLELAVPDGLQVNEVKVNGEVVTIREAGQIRLVPLPESVGPSQPVQVSVRSSRPSEGAGEEIRILSPRVAQTTQLTTRWVVTPDTGYQLEPISAGALTLLTSYSLENGFSWIEGHALWPFTMVVLLWFFGSCLMRVPAAVSVVGAVLLFCAAVAAFYLAAQGMDQQNTLPGVLEYQASVKAPEAGLGVTVKQVQNGKTGFSNLGLCAFLLALVLIFAAMKWRAKKALLLSLAAFAVALALLTAAGGAGWFFLILGAAILFLFWRGLGPVLASWRAAFTPELEDTPEEGFDDEEDDEGGAPSPSKSALTTLLLLGLLSCFGLSSAEGRTQAKELASPTWKAADALTEEWTIMDRRLLSTVDLKLSGKAGERFLLLKAPATLTKFEGENLKVITEAGNYLVVPTAEGSFQAKFSYQTSVAEVTDGVPLLTGLAAVRSLKVSYEAAAWSVDSSAAVRKKSLQGEGSVAQLWLAPERDVMVVLSPKARDVAAEESRYYIEVDDLFVPGPGVVDGHHRIKVRPAQGQVKQLVLTVPQGFTVSEVKSPLVGPWRFDPSTRVLQVDLAPFQSKPFAIEVETQRALAELPAEVSVSPMRVQGAAGEVGMLALAFGGEAQLDRDEAEGMSLVNIADFSSGMLPRDREGRPLATLQKVYRYAQGEAALKLMVAPVAPEVRVESQQRLSFGEERIVLAVDLAVGITRAGVFRLSFPLPPGFEVESLTGAALNHWVEVEEEGQGFVIMNLNGKTMGEQAFSLVLNGTRPELPAQGWRVPQISLREAKRQAGQLLIVPGRGIQLSVERRKDLSALDPRNVGGAQAGSLAFRLLQKSWELDLAVDQLAPSLAVQSLHDIEIREGRSKSRLDLRLRVDYASIRELEVTLPGLSEIDSQTVRASGAEVRDIVNMGDGRWSLRFKRRVIGELPLRIEYEQSEDQALLHTALFPAARQQETFLALRPGARLKLDPVQAPGWERVDWVSLPKSLYQMDRSGAPATFLRTKQPGNAVPVSWKEHEVVSSARMRVVGGSLHTILSPRGELINQAELRLETRQRGSLTLTLPENSRLFGVFVNEESALVVKTGTAYRFHVTGDAGASEASVKFTYANSVAEADLSNLSLQAFKIGEPLENVTWTISVPEGYSMKGRGGDLDFEKMQEREGIDQSRYRSLVAQRKREKEEQSLSRLNKATSFLKAGDQVRANSTLVQVFNQANLDDASNEDVRIKVENLAMQQAVMGLNTRRQRLHDANVWDPQGQENQQIEAATLANPIFAGDLNYGHDDYNTARSGNNADVNRQLDTIAQKWVSKQGITESISQQLDPVIPTSGKALIFTRKIQVDGEQTLSLALDIQSDQASPSVLGRFWILLLIALSLLLFWKLQK